jgi:hypothetical protein
MLIRTQAKHQTHVSQILPVLQCTAGVNAPTLREDCARRELMRIQAKHKSHVSQILSVFLCTAGLNGPTLPEASTQRELIRIQAKHKSHVSQILPNFSVHGRYKCPNLRQGSAQKEQALQLVAPDRYIDVYTSSPRHILHKCECMLMCTCTVFSCVYMLWQRRVCSRYVSCPEGDSTTDLLSTWTNLTRFQRMYT